MIRPTQEHAQKNLLKTKFDVISLECHLYLKDLYWPIVLFFLISKQQYFCVFQTIDIIILFL